MTYLRAAERGRGTPGHRAPHQLVLIATSLVSLLAIGLCYAGRTAVVDRGAAGTINLAQPLQREALEAALTPAFANAKDRRLAATELMRALASPEARAQLANVGGLARIPPFTSSRIAAVKSSFVVRTLDEYRQVVFWCAAVLLLSFQIVSLIWMWRGVSGDRILLAAAHLLTTLGFLVMLSRPDPLRDSLLVLRFTQSVVVALGLFLALSMVNIRTAPFLRLSYVSLGCAVLLSLVLAVFGSGPGTSGAKVNLGPVQPIEAIRLLILVFLAGYLGRRWELVRHVRATAVLGRRLPGWLDLPRIDHVLPVLAGVGISLVLFFALRDLGPALLLSLIFVAMLAIARARLLLVATGLGVLVAGFAGGYWLGISRTLTARVAMWQSPWSNAVRGGDQIAHAAWAMAAGALEGTGLGLGDTRYLPAGHTDLVLAAVGEELGAVGIIAAVAAFGVIAWRGLRAARHAPGDTTVFVTVAMTLTIVAPTIVMAVGTLGLVPLTGVVTPFLSYGGSAMLANFAALGLIAAAGNARSVRRADLPDPPGEPSSPPFLVPLRWLGGALASVAIAVLIAWSRVQVVSADAYLIRPQLSVQADGGLRYQYNPRVLDAARALPRGAILDRRDVPVAGPLDTIRAAESEFGRMRISLRDACPNPQARCYPLGGAMFHVLGDANTRVNWAASNASYVERDQEDGLRGFDDHAIAVRTNVDEEAPAFAVRRDYSDLLPLFRHRWEPEHPAVQALMSRPRDVRITVDARLQKQVTAILANAAVAARVDRAAAVVVDAATGELLASVTYPSDNTEDEGLLDRARYGLYPPGSTFKLVTAAAALRQDPALSQLPFTCSRLSHDRVGAKIPGFGRPVRDDILDHEPHGTLTMHDGLVRSCNAYFAQLAVRLGARALASTATLAGISYPTSGSAERVREDLPYAGYGQGRVLATPLRMARVAAAIGSDGQIREPSIVLGEPPSAPKPFLSADASRQLAGYMRDVVTEGTGRSLKAHAIHIAGKTGTAEVDGAKSHGWFVGFAPSDPAAHRIAFAVILENAGYGGASAAPVAGQMVSAAASLGLIK